MVEVIFDQADRIRKVAFVINALRADIRFVYTLYAMVFPGEVNFN